METENLYKKPVVGENVTEKYDSPYHVIEMGDHGKIFDIRYAVDFITDEKTTVHVSRGGKVVKVIDGRKKLWEDIENPPPKGYFKTEDEKNGNYVVILHENGELSAYCHLRLGHIAVKKGDTVKQGEQIAEVGHNGISKKPHLHFVVGVEYLGNFISRKIRWE